MTDKQRIDALQWVVIVVGAIALISFLFVIQLGEEINDLNNQIATIEATLESTP